MRRTPVAAVVIAATIIVAGCSSNNATPEQPSSTQPTSTHGAYAKCLQDHGISAPPGPVAGPPPGTDEHAWHEATGACASLAPGPSTP